MLPLVAHGTDSSVISDLVMSYGLLIHSNTVNYVHKYTH